MAKPIKTRLKLQISGGAATPAVGKDLGQHQINIPDFCKKFNALTADRKVGSCVDHGIYGQNVRDRCKNPVGI
jgi:ribosomal protein L11